MVLSLVSTIFIGLIVGMIFQKIKIPGGMLLGSVVGSALLNIIFSAAYMPSPTKIVAQALAGAFIACSVKREDLRKMAGLLKPSLIVLSVHLVLNIIVGFIIYKIGTMDLITSFMCAVPGGLSDIPLIAADMGADPSKVFALQFLRMLVGIGLFPSIINSITKHDTSKYNSISSSPAKKSVLKHSLLDVIVTATTALVFGFLGHYLKIPAGTLLFALLAVIVLNLVTGKACLPILGKRLAQLLSGLYIGSSMTYEEVLELRHLIVPAIILILGYSISCFVIGFLLRRFCKISLKEGMLIGIPAGASDMALIASDMGIESAELILIQVIRLLVVVSIFPQIIAIIISFVQA